MGYDYGAFLEDLAQRESSGQLDKVNDYGYLGLYQMGEAALIDAGYYQADGTAANDWTGTWTGKDGIDSAAEFLASRPAQDAAVAAYHDKQWDYITRFDLDQYAGATVGDIPITASGLIAAAHLGGVGNLRSFLESGGGDVFRDGLGTPITQYYRDLEAMVSQGAFREDLYYRLNVFPIEVPSLASRIEDLPLLVEDLLSRIEPGQRVRLTPAALERMGDYGWPGNVRELANLLERLAILYPGQGVDADRLPDEMRMATTPGTESRLAGERGEDVGYSLPLPAEGIDLAARVRAIEAAYIRQALDVTQGVATRAAVLLGLRRTTLVEKMRKYRIGRKEGDRGW